MNKTTYVSNDDAGLDPDRAAQYQSDREADDKPCLSERERALALDATEESYMVIESVHYADEPGEHADLDGWNGPGWYFWINGGAWRCGPFLTENRAKYYMIRDHGGTPEIMAASKAAAEKYRKDQLI